MNKLTDLEICERIGQIVCPAGFTVKCRTNNKAYFVSNEDIHSWTLCDPIHDDSMNLKLRDTFEADINYEEKSVAVYIKNGQGAAFWNDNTSINSAVCLAIIEAHDNEYQERIK